jgi:hypothetical protein
MRVDVLNPDGRDAPVDYRGGVTAPAAPGHPPINFWAFAAATGGRFHQSVATVTEPCDAVLVLIRQRVNVSRDAVRALKRRGCRVWVSWKETGRYQIPEQTRWWFRRSQLRELLAAADGALAATAAAAACYREYGPPELPVHGLPTPYPVDVPGWDHSCPVAERRGIFIGTRQFDVPGRRHAEALALANDVARQTGARVTVCNFDGSRAAAQVRRLLPDVRELQLVEQRMSYSDYLRLMASHRLVLQRDASGVPGQVAGDALLCRLVNVGGDGAVQQRIFAEFAEPACGEAALREAGIRLLTDDAFYAGAVATSQQRALDQLSFAWARQALAQALSSSA